MQGQQWRRCRRWLQDVPEVHPTPLSDGFSWSQRSHVFGLREVQKAAKLQQFAFLSSLCSMHKSWERPFPERSKVSIQKLTSGCFGMFTVVAEVSFAFLLPLLTLNLTILTLDFLNLSVHSVIKRRLGLLTIWSVQYYDLIRFRVAPLWKKSRA